MCCHNEALYPRRWCEARNLVYFLVPGQRAPPLDKDIDYESIVLPFKLSTLPRNLTHVDPSTTLSCYVRFQNVLRDGVWTFGSMMRIFWVHRVAVIDGVGMREDAYHCGCQCTTIIERISPGHGIRT
jgi:hypothetical protein